MRQRSDFDHDLQITPLFAAARMAACMVFIIVFGSSTVSCSVHRGGFTLPSPTKYQRTLQGSVSSGSFDTLVEGMATQTKSIDPLAPRIVVVEPSPNEDVQPPFRLAIRFHATPGAQIDPSSFRVIYEYGWFHKDITDRILPFVSLTDEGASGTSSSSIPVGRYKMLLEIRDTKDRLGTTTAVFRVK